MLNKLEVSLSDLSMAFSNALDLIAPGLVNHHQQVAYIALDLGLEFGLSKEQQEELALAGILHDIGAILKKERLDLLQFDTINPYKHSNVGGLLLNLFAPFSKIATLVRYHHTRWDEMEKMGHEIPTGSHILHLADRTAVLMGSQDEILGQVQTITEKIKEESNKMFMSQLVGCFLNIAEKEYFWLDATSPSKNTFWGNIRLSNIQINLEDVLSLANLFSHIIDFRSRFTATHSSGVAATAETLAGLMGFSEDECRLMKIAGYLHDLGKLYVPEDILEKPAKLNVEEFNVIRMHTYFTYHILEPIKEFALIRDWGAFHHERLDGKGYPFHLQANELSFGARIMAVADVFTAITEDRPYRKGMSSQQALQIIQQMAENSILDKNIVLKVRDNFELINDSRITAQKDATEIYQKFIQVTDTIKDEDEKTGE